jgi:hypothetical protein
MFHSNCIGFLLDFEYVDQLLKETTDEEEEELYQEQQNSLKTNTQDLKTTNRTKTTNDLNNSQNTNNLFSSMKLKDRICLFALLMHFGLYKTLGK